MGRSFATAGATELQSSGDRLDVAGTYHFLVENFKYGEMPHNDDYFEGYSLSLAVLGGDPHGNASEESVIGKTVGLLLNDPSESHKDKGEFARRRLTAAFIATNLMKVEDAGKSVDIDESMAAGAQIVATVRFGKNKDGSKSEYLDLDGAKIYHVDDPRASGVKKHAEKLAEIHAAYRHPAEYFKPILPVTAAKAATGSANGQATAGAQGAAGGAKFDETGL